MMNARSDRESESWGTAPVFDAPLASGIAVVRPGAYALLANESQEIAIVRAPDGTGLPGGGIDPGESEEDALRRECIEECGLIVRAGGWRVRAIQFAWAEMESMHFEKRCTFFDVAFVGPAARAPDPGHEVLCIAAARAAEYLRQESQVWAVEHWLRRSELRG